MTKDITHILGAKQTKIATSLGWVAIRVNSSQIRQLRLAAEHIGPECIQLGYGLVPRGLFDHFPLRILPWRRSPGTLMLQQQMWCPDLLRTHFSPAIYFLCHVLNHSLTEKKSSLCNNKTTNRSSPCKNKSLLQQQHKQLFSLSLSPSSPFFFLPPILFLPFFFSIFFPNFPALLGIWILLNR